MKPPDHPVASGDRRMAAAFVDLLAALGHRVDLACRLRTRDGTGDPVRQRRLEALGARAARLLLARWGRDPRRRPDLWFTYHLYHKAPDPIGWRVADALGIPYVVAEASVARRRAEGPWREGFAAALRALSRADALLAMTRRDLEGLRRVYGTDPRLVRFPPFLDTAPFDAAVAERARHRETLARRYGLDGSVPWLLTVAMMRADVKLRSYRFLADAVAALADRPWRLLVVGAGEAEHRVRAALAPVAERVVFLGALAPERLPPVYASCDLYLWPGFGEAYGMSYLEAQAAGLPVVALAEAGVADVVADGHSGVLLRDADPEVCAAATRALLENGDRRHRLSATARARVRELHGREVAAARLAAVLAPLLRSRSTALPSPEPSGCPRS